MSPRCRWTSAVLDNKGHFIPNIPRGKFRVLEDNVPQQISTFSTNADAPMTIAMVIEFSNLYQQYWAEGWYQTLVAAYGFVQTLKPDDYVAVDSLRHALRNSFAISPPTGGRPRRPCSACALPDSRKRISTTRWSDTEQRMTNIEGRKAIVLIASGRDTFSKLTYDKARKAIQEARVPIYAISLLQASRIMADPYMGPMQRMDFLQADNQMNTFARETGGQALLPALLRRVPGHFPNYLTARCATNTPSPISPPIRPRTENFASSKWNW